ncbi:MAG: hypothetical protein AMXMBFR6_00480 [Betaproteobacteria bacterium]
MKVMVLAAGRGERMRPLTDHTPKPLLEVGGKPLIMWTLERLARAGLNDVVINAAHLGDQLHASLGDGARWGVRIGWSDEPAGALDTAGGLRKALPLLGPGPFLAVAADVYCDAPFAQLARVATQLRADADLAHLWLVPNPLHHVEGDFRLNGDRVLPAGEGNLTFSGIAAYHPALFADLSLGVPVRLAHVLAPAIAAGRVGGERLAAEWWDVGTPQRLAALDARLRSPGGSARSL